MSESKTTKKSGAKRAKASQVRTSGTEGTKRAERQRKRVPISGDRDILTVIGRDPKFVYRLVNDIDNRIQRFQDAGYDFVTHEVQIGDAGVQSSDNKGGVVTVNVRGGIVAYLMRIKREWYEEDQAAKQADLDASQEELYRELNSTDNGRYGNVSIGQMRPA